MNEQMMQQIQQLVLAAMSGDQKAAQQIQQIQQAAQQGDQQATLLMGMIQQVAQLLLGSNLQQVPAPAMAAKGAKLNYIKRLNGICPEGYKMEYHKMGGQICSKCTKVAEKKAEGGVVEDFKQKLKQKRAAKKSTSTKLDPKTTKVLPGGKYPTYWTPKQRMEWEDLHGDQDEGAHVVLNKGIGKNACGAKLKPRK